MLKSIKKLFKLPNKSTGLTKRETKTILKIAAKSGSDWDGDILRLYVDTQQGVVKVLKP